jgi:hypothetical protein
MVSYNEIVTRFQQFLKDHDTVRRAGFQDIMAEHQHRIDNFRQAMDRKRLGVCAKVTVRIEQELVLTRQAFEAKLEIDNGDSRPMEAIKVRARDDRICLPCGRGWIGTRDFQNQATRNKVKGLELDAHEGNGFVFLLLHSHWPTLDSTALPSQVVFRITRDGDDGSYEEVFAIGNPELEGGLTGTEGNGTLIEGSTGSATWLMIPRSEAAPGIDDVQYLVRGKQSVAQLGR